MLCDSVAFEVKDVEKKEERCACDDETERNEEDPKRNFHISLLYHEEKTTRASTSLR